MITKLIYFRPEKRSVPEELLEKKYSCVIHDEFSFSETSVTVPQYLTILQHFNIPKLHYKKRKPVENEFLEKLCIHLVGSPQAPKLEHFVTNVFLIDRIEFHGHIGFEEPVFAIMRQLPDLRKVTFVLNPCKQQSFAEEAQDNEKKSATFANEFVTCLKIVVNKFCTKQECNKCKDSNINSTKKTLEKMVIQLLKRSAKQCHNIKRLTLDVPNTENIREEVSQVVKDLKRLKPTTVLMENDWITVRKTSDIPAPPPDPETVPESKENLPPCEPNLSVHDTLATAPFQDETSSFPELTTASQTQTKEPCTDSNNDATTTGVKINPFPVPVEPSSSSIIGFKESDAIGTSTELPCLGLGDMSKILGSMLGIPSTSGGQSSSAKLPLSNQSTSNVLPNPLAKSFSSSSQSSEVISYAAAAAAASNNKLAFRHLCVTGNDSQQNKSGAEGSRRTFFFEGTKPPQVENSSKRNHKNPSSIAIAISSEGSPLFSNSNGGANTASASTSSSSTRHIKA